MRLVAAQGGQRADAVLRQLVEADAGHGLEDQLVRRRQGQQHLGQRVTIAVSDCAAAADEILDEALLERLALRQRLRREGGQIDHLDAVFAQHLGEPVVLLLRAVEVRDVVKEQPLQRVRHELLELAARALQQHLLQLANFTFHTNRHTFHSVSSLICALFYHNFVPKTIVFFINRVDCARNCLIFGKILA